MTTEYPSPIPLPRIEGPQHSLEFYGVPHRAAFNRALYEFMVSEGLADGFDGFRDGNYTRHVPTLEPAGQDTLRKWRELHDPRLGGSNDFDALKPPVAPDRPTAPGDTGWMPHEPRLPVQPKPGPRVPPTGATFTPPHQQQTLSSAAPTEALAPRSTASLVSGLVGGNSADPASPFGRRASRLVR